MNTTRYEFENCLGGFFQMSTVNARRILPRHLQPIEIQHTRSVLAALAFQFTASEVGPYDELVLAIIAPPLVTPGAALPKAAFYPFMVATSTTAARLRAIQRWHLPHHMSNLDFAFHCDDDSIGVRVTDGGTPALELTVTRHEFAPAANLYHLFTTEAGADKRFKVNVTMRAPHSEHEAERGRLTLFDHALAGRLDCHEVDPIPFREEWYRAGTQVFERLEEV